MTEEQLDAIRERARGGEGKAEFELATLYMGDYFKQRVINSLRALFKGALKVYDSAVVDYSNSINDYIIEDYENYKSQPSSEKLNELIVNTIHALTHVDPGGMAMFTSRLMEGVRALSEATPQILDRHYPEWRKMDGIFNAVSKFINEPAIEAFYDVIDQIKKTATYKGDGKIIDRLLADAFFKGETAAACTLAIRKGYKTKGVCVDNNILVGVMGDKNNMSFPSICVGKTAEIIKVSEDKKLTARKMVDFFTPDVSRFDHFITVAYDNDSKDSRNCANSIVQTMLASMLAWIGPQKFTLDVIDFEHTGVGSYPAQFLPEKKIKIISRLEDWPKELDSLESLVEKRSRQMQSIFEYNQAHPDMPELYKVIVVQDFDGTLISYDEPEGEHPDQKEKERAEQEEANADRFIHLLEIGYRYGLFFIIAAGPDVYEGSTETVDCTRDFSCPTFPYNTTYVEGVSRDEKDWLMKWLSGGEEIKRQGNRAKASDKQDGADGILITPIADDGVDIEFNFDTVSHTHAFVIGKTGSGKSVLLHNIITGLVNSYGPDDLELYLLDLKMGGVEFNRYRRLPHLRSLLVDNSDIQIVLEIMRDIELMMRERGKAFRNAGVSNIKEYNRAHPDKKMAQVIVVIDECHAIFSMGGGRGAAKDQREITERLVKIAKEGRSQGIHLIFATQTLSGSEIPPDIQKNITDYYLLKCAPSDSESLVRGSSSQTEALPVGKVYYYHADRQALFQGIYNDNEACEELIAEALRRHQGKTSHGQFYFNGAQTFELNKEVIDKLLSNGGHAVAGSPGRMINLQQTPIAINLKKDYSENLLLTGINNDEQLSRTTLALMGSQILAAKTSGKRLKVNVINCLDSDTEASALLREMADNGIISLYRPADSDSLLKRLCDNVSQTTLSDDTMLYVISQERFSELKRDQKFAVESHNETTEVVDLFQGLNFNESGSDSKSFDTFKKALVYLLENGPSVGLHVVIQIDKPDKLLFEDFISAKIVSSRFKHVVALRSDLRAATSLGLSDDLNVDTLSADPERLRAFYYNDEEGATRLFSPYEMITTSLLE